MTEPAKPMTVTVWAAPGRRVRGKPGPHGEAGALIGDAGIEIAVEETVTGSGAKAVKTTTPTDPFWLRKWQDGDVTATKPPASAGAGSAPAAAASPAAPAEPAVSGAEPAAGADAGAASKRGK